MQGDPNQWGAYYGYGQGYESYAYGTTQDQSTYAYGTYPGYSQYPQQVRHFSCSLNALKFGQNECSRS